MSNLENKVVWLTGASSGIGEALALALAKQQVKLVISARRVQELERVKKALNLSDDKCFIQPLDLEKIETFEQATKNIIAKFGSIDILVNNAGLSQRSLAKDTSIEVDKRLMNVNYIGTVALSKCVLPYMLQSKTGLFVTITSAVGKIPSPWRSSYAASKHALHGFFDSLRAECYDEGIRVLLVCPGFISTNVSVNALTGNGMPLGQMDDATQKGLSPQQCAEGIIQAIKSGKEEVIIGGLKEKFGIWMKRHFPSIFSIMIRKMKVR